MSGIRVVSKNEKDKYVDCMVTAFAADPMVRFLFPTASSYLQAARPVFDLYAGTAIQDGTMWTIDDFAGVSTWLSPIGKQDFDPLEVVLERHVPADRLDESTKCFDQLHALHPTEPHWYLPIIGVDPASWGHGRGGRLMEYTLKIVDAENLPVFLESTNPLNVSLYKRFGFEVIQTLELGGKPIVTPMIRPAQG